MTTTKRFTFSIQYEHTLSVDQIWPNGDAPDNPTADEVRQVFLNTCYGNIHDGLRKWFLTPESGDVVVTEVVPMKVSFGARKPE